MGTNNVVDDDDLEVGFEAEPEQEAYVLPPNVVEVEEDFGDLDLSVFEEPPITFDKVAGVAEIDTDVYDRFVDKKGYYNMPVGHDKDTGAVKKKRVKATRVRKRRKQRNFIIGKMFDENFGPLLPYVQDINVTDINWNGKQLWIDDVNKGKYMSDITLSDEFVNAFSVRMSNVVSRTFNQYTPRLEAETKDLRVTILHESASNTGRAISIRKTPPVKRIEFAKSIRSGSYCTEEVANFISNTVKAKRNIAICGLPGVGKTELVKYLTNYIFPRDRVITIEDTMELHYSSINPGKDCLEMKVDENNFTYTDAIKISVRMSPQWIILSEARSREVRYLLETVSTGGKCITTLHADDVRKIPKRVVAMMGEEADGVLNPENTVYDFFDVGICIEKKQDVETGNITRWIEQVCVFSSKDGVNKCTMVSALRRSRMWKQAILHVGLSRSVCSAVKTG